MKATSSLHRFLLVTGSLIAFATTIYAETTWIGSVDNNWHNQDNWSNGLPGVGTMNGGTANASAEIRIGDAAIGSFTMNDGILNASARIAISENGGTGTFNIHGGTVNHTTGDIFVGLRNDSSGTLNIHGGTLTTSSLIAGHTNGTGTVNMYGGSLTGGSINIGDWNGSPSTFNMYSGAQVHSEDRIRIGRQSVGTFRAWLDGSEFNPMTGDGTLILNDQNQTAHLDVALVGGVMLSGHSSFDLIDAADGQAGNWVSTPNASLWATDSLAGQVTVSLASAANLGTLDAATVGDTINDTSNIVWHAAFGTAHRVGLFITDEHFTDGVERELAAKFPCDRRRMAGDVTVTRYFGVADRLLA